MAKAKRVDYRIITQYETPEFDENGLAIEAGEPKLYPNEIEDDQWASDYAKRDFDNGGINWVLVEKKVRGKWVEVAYFHN